MPFVSRSSLAVYWRANRTGNSKRPDAIIPPAEVPMIGQTVSHYLVLERLGVGAMGVVYLAQDTSLGRKVALKFLSGDLAPTDEARARLIREARAASALNHPLICVIHEVGEHEGQPFIAMEWLEGETLKSRSPPGSRVSL